MDDLGFNKKPKKGVPTSAPGGYGTISERGYRRVWDTKQKRYRMEHDMIWEAQHGPIPEGRYVHHKDGIKLNNTIGNLELVDALTHKRIHGGCKLIAGEWWKPCTRCKEIKKVSTDFYLARGWIQSICKACQIQVSIQTKKARKKGSLNRMR